MIAPPTRSRCSRMLAATPVKKRSRPGTCSAKRIDEGEPVNVLRFRRHRVALWPARPRVDCELLSAFWREFHKYPATDLSLIADNSFAHREQKRRPSNGTREHLNDV